MSAMTALRALLRQHRGRALSWPLALWLAACGGGTEVLIIPLFEFGFSGTANGVAVQVFFLPDTPTTHTGSFSQVNMNVDSVQSRYDGSWTNCSFKLALQAGQTVTPPGAASYDGRFTGNDSIELTPTSGSGLPTLALKRQGTSVRQIGC